MPKVTDTLIFLQLSPSDKELCPEEPTEDRLHKLATGILHRVVDQQPGLIDSVVAALRKVSVQKQAAIANHTAHEANRVYAFMPPRPKSTGTTPPHTAPVIVKVTNFPPSSVRQTT
jgi:hypothetical protein